VLLWLGVILVFVGWFTGGTRFGTAVRTTVSGGLESVGASLADGPAAATGRWVVPNAAWLRIVIGVLGVITLLWGNQASEPRLFWAVVVVVVLLVALQVLVGTGKAASPSEPADPEVDRPGPSGEDPADEATAPIRP
jgi:hypothetical protein